ncbi:MAG: HrpA-like helicase, partial [uncultured Gemmatimonadaceae bacterium]
HRHGEDARGAADRRGDPQGAAQGGGGEPRARGHARAARAERDRGDHRDRAPLVPGRRHPAARHARRRRDPPDVGGAGAVPLVRQARRVPLHLALGHRGPDVLPRLPQLRRRPRGVLVRPQEGGGREGGEPAAGRLPRRQVRDAAGAAEARRGGVPPHARRRGAGRRRRRGALPAPERGVLPRRGADPRDPPVPRGGRRREAVPARDDGGRPERAQRARPRHGDHRRHAVHQRDRPRAQRAHPRAPGEQRDPADGRARARARGGRAGVHPLRPRHRVHRAAPHRARVPARRRLRAGGAHLRRPRRARRRARPPRAARPRGLPPRLRPPAAARDHRRARAALAVRQVGGGAAGGPRVGGAHRERRRRAGALPRRDELHREPAPHDARGARPRRADRAGERQPHELQPVRRGVRARRLRGRGVRAPAAPVRRRGDRAVGGGARGAGEERGGRGARDGERLPRRGAPAPHGDAARDERDLPALHRPRRALHALRPRDRRGDGRRAPGAGVEDERVRELGRGGRHAALLRRPLRRAARVDRGHADPGGPAPPLRAARPAGALLRRAAQAHAARAPADRGVLRLRAGARERAGGRVH